MEDIKSYFLTNLRYLQQEQREIKKQIEEFNFMHEYYKEESRETVLKSFTDKLDILSLALKNNEEKLSSYEKCYAKLFLK